MKLQKLTLLSFALLLFMCGCESDKPSSGVATLRLNLTLPQSVLPDNPDVAPTLQVQSETYNLRAVVEFYKKGSLARIKSSVALLKKASEDRYVLDVDVERGDYDILLWIDYTPQGSTEDLYYKTSSLKGVTFNRNLPYQANTDSRDAYYYGKISVAMPDAPVFEQTVTLERPLAKYRLIATDVDKYKEFVANYDKPALETLKATIIYEGYFPCSFNVSTGRPNDAKQGYRYHSTVTDITDDGTATLGSDFVFVDTESSVMATVIVTDAAGHKISEASGVKIDYRRGLLTTVGGNFLTVGLTGGGIEIDTEWTGTKDVEF